MRFINAKDNKIYKSIKNYAQITQDWIFSFEFFNQFLYQNDVGHPIQILNNET